MRNLWQYLPTKYKIISKKSKGIYIFWYFIQDQNNISTYRMCNKKIKLALIMVKSEVRLD